MKPRHSWVTLRSWIKEPAWDFNGALKSLDLVTSCTGLYSSQLNSSSVNMSFTLVYPNLCSGFTSSEKPLWHLLPNHPSPSTPVWSLSPLCPIAHCVFQCSDTYPMLTTFSSLPSLSDYELPKSQGSSIHLHPQHLDTAQRFSVNPAGWMIEDFLRPGIQLVLDKLSDRSFSPNWGFREKNHFISYGATVNQEDVASRESLLTSH